MKKMVLSLGFSLISILGFSQAYEFQTLKDIDAMPVISQDKTGTCWSFSTTSFLEAEIIRLTGKKIDLSEMFMVRNTYPKKAENYVMRQGKAPFSEGGLAHDVINAIKEAGIMPNEVYNGLRNGNDKHNHAELQSVLEAMLRVYVDNPAKKLSPQWKEAVSAVLDVYLGQNPKEFVYENLTYSPTTFMTMTKLKPDNYISLTSFQHQPYYSKFILNIPDNFSNGSFYNLPLDEFIETIDNALDKGYTLALDCDVSEDTFDGRKGIAVVPESESDSKKAMKEIVIEKKITPEFRQTEFENYTTTDDHLMHIVGKVKDQKGNIYYKVKNSWGTANMEQNGYVYMSVAYMKLKSISVLMHKEGINSKTKKSLGL